MNGEEEGGEEGVDGGEGDGKVWMGRRGGRGRVWIGRRVVDGERETERCGWRGGGCGWRRGRQKGMDGEGRRREGVDGEEEEKGGCGWGGAEEERNEER